MEYVGSSAGFMTKTGAQFPVGVQGGSFAGAVALLPSDPLDSRVLVMSQLTEFFGSGHDAVNRSTPGVAFGVRGNFRTVPPGYASEAVLVLTVRSR